MGVSRREFIQAGTIVMATAGAGSGAQSAGGAVTAAIPLQGVPDYTIFEYACHEGNYSIRNVLSGARAQEQAK